MNMSSGIVVSSFQARCQNLTKCRQLFPADGVATNTCVPAEEKGVAAAVYAATSSGGSRKFLGCSINNSARLVRRCVGGR